MRLQRDDLPLPALLGVVAATATVARAKPRIQKKRVFDN
jgi:hypothetical protein